MTDPQQHHMPAGQLRRRLTAILPAAFLLPLLTLALLGAAWASPARAAARDRAPGGNFQNPVVRQVDIAAPAVVRMATLYYGHITLDLTGCGAVTLPTSGPGYLVGGLGSGAFISANGDVLTADHVVNIPRADLDGEILGQDPSALQIADAINACPSVFTSQGFAPQKITDSDVAGGILSQLGVNYTTSYSAPKFYVWRDTAWSGVLQGTNSNTDIIGPLLSVQYQLGTVVASSTFDQNDVAIVHVPLTDTPSIRLDSATDVAVEDNLTIMGFPGNGDASLDPTDLLTVSVNSGMVSAIKTNDSDGATLIQVGGNVEHGDSGGPALDAQGNIVGIVSFGGTDTPGITSFLRTSDNAQTLISGAGISTAPGHFETAWEQAFDDYAATTPGHWHKAAQELQALSSGYPAFQGMVPYLRYAQTQADQESLTPPGPTVGAPLVLGGAGTIAALAVLGIVLVLVRSRRRQQAVAAAAAQSAAAYGAYTQPSSYGYGYGPPSGPYAPPSGSGGAPWPPSGYPAAGTATGPSAPSTPLDMSPAATSGRGTPSAPVATATRNPGVCLNGHAMAPGMVSCGICGAPRRAQA